jgi:tetratricopeptide (TPR) repeat protein
MQVLLTLAEADGAVVTRDMLFARCWGGVFVGDDSLNRAIGGVRRVATGVAAGSFAVETVPRTGYRLIGERHAHDDQNDALADHSQQPAANVVSRRQLVGGGLVAAAVGGVALWTNLLRVPDPATPFIEQSRTVMRSGTQEGQRKAVALLERAVKIAPESAAAWGLLALTLARTDEHAVGRPVTSAARVDEAAQRALRLDPDNADADAARAIAIPYYGDWLPAERRFDWVIAHHPDHIFIRDSRSFFLGAVGRMHESARSRLAFAAGSPFDADLHNRKIYAHWFLGQIAEADQAAQRGLAMWPGYAPIWFARLWLLASTGRLDRAVAQIDDAAHRPTLPDAMVATLRTACLAALSRNSAEIELATRRVMASVRGSLSAVINAMMLLNLMDATDAAFAVSEAYYLERGPIIAAMEWRPGQPFLPDQRRRKTNMLFTPTCARMQRDPRFMPLMRDIGLADYWRRRGVVPDFLGAGRG